MRMGASAYICKVNRTGPIKQRKIWAFLPGGIFGTMGTASVVVLRSNKHPKVSAHTIKPNIRADRYRYPATSVCMHALAVQSRPAANAEWTPASAQLATVSLRRLNRQAYSSELMIVKGLLRRTKTGCKRAHLVTHQTRLP